MTSRASAVCAFPIGHAGVQARRISRDAVAAASAAAAGFTGASWDTLKAGRRTLLIVRGTLPEAAG